MKHTVTEHKLSSGAKGLIINVPASDVANIVVRFNSGYQFADQSKYEVPHVMEHLLATVTEKYSGPNAFAIEVQRNGAYVNAHTSSNVNGYVYECADFELDRILDLLEEQLVRPLFAPEALKAEISNVREELSRNTTLHQRVCNIRLDEAAFPGQAKDYEERIARLETITVDDMVEHYRRTHTAANARFYVAGSFADGGKQVIARLEKLFSQLPTGKRLELNTEVGRDVARPLITERDIAQLYYSVGFYAPGIELGQRPALALLRLLMTGGFGSRIMGELRQRGLAYGIGMSSGATQQHAELEVSAFVTPANAAALFEVVARHLKAAYDGQLTKDELEAAKQLGIGSTKRSHQTASDMLSWYAIPYDNEGRILDFDAYMDTLTATTVDEVAAIAHQILSYGHHGASFVGPIKSAQAGKLLHTLDAIWE